MFLKESRALLVLSLSLSIFVSVPRSLWACACGCGIFDVGTGALMPTHEGGLAYLEYDDMNQSRNWSGSSKAPAENNSDVDLRTSFFTVGAQYMFNHQWGAMLEVPYTARHFETMGDDGNNTSSNHSALGDIRLRGVYTGFSPNLSTGLTFGIKFPSGDYRYANFDRDTEVGSGSTDLLVGGFHRGQITSDNAFSWFANVQIDLPVLITPAYRPGNEVDAVVGTYCNGWRIGAVKIAPVAQALGSVRWSDTGEDSAHPDSGYKRAFLSPGIEISAASWRLYGDVAFPVYQHVNGNQLVASELYKLNISHGF